LESIRAAWLAAGRAGEKRSLLLLQAADFALQIRNGLEAGCKNLLLRLSTEIAANLAFHCRFHAVCPTLRSSLLSCIFNPEGCLPPFLTGITFFKSYLPLQQECEVKVGLLVI